ncbi:MAG: type II toxin-antitoxin system HigA family antitoxin [Verrucomicrobiota bacterium]
MKTQTATKVRAFNSVPKDYSCLCSGYLPRPIHDDHEYAEAQKAIFELVGFEEQLTPDQTDYLEAVSTFIEQYDQQTVSWSRRNPKSILKYLMAEHGMSGADLARSLGMNESMGGKILRGERNLTVEHIRFLSSKFSVSPELFIA